MFFIADLSIVQHNVMGSGFFLKAGVMSAPAIECVFVRRVFKADPVKQTEPGHGRIEWKRVGESEGEREREPGVIERGIQWEKARRENREGEERGRGG